ncbi:armadillo-type protein [Spinellus fusiger]|nr:armadillo-type protein [Spinellus fusiger]
MPATNAYMVANLLDKMNNEDRDFRYMALNDLMNELQKPSFLLDSQVETKVVYSVVKLMNDKNGEVQNLAVKCLGPLVKQIQDNQIIEIIDCLCRFAVQKDNEELRGIASVGLKTVVIEVSPSKGDLIINTFTPKALQLLNTLGVTYEMQIDSLDVLAEVIARFGSQIHATHQAQLKTVVVPLLAHSRAAVRKRAVNVMGHYVVNANDVYFKEFVGYLLTRLNEKTATGEKLRTLVQCCGVLSRYSTSRLAEYLPQLMAILEVYISEADNDDELREICLQTIESFVVRCPRRITPYTENILTLGLEYLKYDPNVIGGEEEEEDEAMEEEEEFDDIIDDSDDDDDMSWKVRRSAIKLLAAVIETRSDILEQLYKTVAPALIQRFKEREESVRNDVLQTFIVLLRQTNMYGGDPSPLATEKTSYQFDITGNESTMDGFRHSFTETSSQPAVSDEGNARRLLRQLVPKLSYVLTQQLSSKSTQTRQIGFHLLRELVDVLRGGLEDHVALFVPVIVSSLTSTISEHQQIALTSNLKIEVLVFLRQFLKTHPPQVFYPHLHELCPVIIRSLTDKFYKVTSESFLVCVEIVKVIRPLYRKADTGEWEIVDVREENKAYLSEIFDTTLSVLSTNDADQEVKERSIMCLGALMAQAGDVLASRQKEAWTMMLDRLRNEVTRLISLRTLGIVSQSVVVEGSEMERCAVEAVDEIGLLLRKNNRMIRIASLECLNVLVKRFGQSVSSSSCDTLLVELRPMVSDADLHLLPLTLMTIESIITASPSSGQRMKDSIVPSLFQLIRSPLLQGSALSSLLSLFGALVKVRPEEYYSLVNGLVDPLLNVHTSGVSAGGVAAVANKHAAATVAQCVTALTVNTSDENRQKTIHSFQSYIESTTTNDSIKYLSLLTLGEIGRRIDLSYLENIHHQILNLFSAQSEEVKFAAAFALGNISLGNINRYLPMIIGQMKEYPKRCYLLLHALKEIITRYDQHSKNNSLGDASNEIWDILLESSESEQEEGTRTVVAECLGKLALTDPPKFLPQLEKRLSSSSSHIRATVVTAIKYAVVDPSRAYDALLRPILSQFLTLLQDMDLNVCRLALLAINSAVHRKPYLIRSVLDKLIPLLYEATVIREELIHMVEMGPFKHKVDDGLEIRKAAYECMYTLLSTCLDKIDIHGFLDRVRAGLDDQHEIKMLAYLMLARLSKIANRAVTQKLDDLVIPFKSTLDFKMRSNAVKQEVEKNQELVRAALRCIVALSVLADEDTTPKFVNFIKEVSTGVLARDYKITLSEAENRENKAVEYMDLS